MVQYDTVQVSVCMLILASKFTSISRKQNWPATKLITPKIPKMSLVSDKTGICPLFSENMSTVHKKD